MDAERADRISRLAGLERLVPGTTAPRNPSNLAAPSASSYTAGSVGQTHQQHPAYFDANNNPQMLRERSTVGSASATGSVGGRTTWASGSQDGYDPDKMSEDQDGDGDTQMEAETASSVGGFSDEASLVGFGEGARTPARAHSSAGGAIPGSPLAGKTTPTTATALPPYARDGAEGQRQDARMIDGMTYDQGVVDTTTRTPPVAGAGEARDGGAEEAERIMGGRFERDAGLQSDGAGGLGKFGFEGK